ncbi:MAG: hypothetical protein QOK42_2766 [Frankiaceae bacterium]|nr:hypothetical protein [Frankiaceae bacterium]
MRSTRAAARIGTVVAATATLGLMAGGVALAAVGTDAGISGPSLPAAAHPVAGVVPAPAVAATPTPTPTADPVGTVLSAVGTVLDTAKNTLGGGPTPTPTATAPAVPPVVGGGPDSGSGGTVTPPRPRAPRPHVRPVTAPGSITSGSLGSFGAYLGDRRPYVSGVAGPVQGSVKGIGAIAVPALSPAAGNTLGDEGEGDSLPGLLVVCAAACVAAAAAGNAEVWRRRLADKLA